MIRTYIYILFIVICGCNAEVNVTFKSQSISVASSVTLTKLSVADSIFKGSSNSIDCGYYLIGIKNSQRPSTFVYNNRVYFNIPCKTSDSSAGGWHMGLMYWTLGGGSVWYDGDGGTAGDNEVVSRTDLDQNGFAIYNNRNFYMVDTGAGLLGLTYKYFLNTDYSVANVPALFPASGVVTTTGYYSIGFSTATPEALTSTDIFVDEIKGAASYDLSDNTWKGKTQLNTELHYKSGTVYLYNTTTNDPTSDTYYISVTTTTDMINYTLPSNFILQNYKYPNVFEYNNNIYMIAFNLTDDKWYIIPGSSPTNFDTSRAEVVNLADEMVGGGGWDDTPLFTSLGDDQPEIAGVEVLNNKVYIFYMAGQFGHMRTPANGTTGSPYDSARGIGAFELDCDLF